MLERAREIAESVGQVELLKASDVPSVVLYYVDWCPFSLMMRDNIDLIRPVFKDLLFLKVPLDSFHADANFSHIQSFPTLHVYMRGLTVLQYRGLVASDIIESELHKVVKIFLNVNSHPPTPVSQQVDATLSPRTRPVLPLIAEVIREYGGRPKGINLICRERSIDLHFGPAQAAIIILLYYAKKMDRTRHLLRDGVPTEVCHYVVKEIKRDLGFRGHIPSLDDLDKKKRGHFAKKVSGINIEMKQISVFNFIERTPAGDYLLSDSFDIVMEVR